MFPLFYSSRSSHHRSVFSIYPTLPTTLSTGAKNHAVYITDIFNQPRSTFFHTHSDVFSLTRQHVRLPSLISLLFASLTTQDLVYAGTRNGSIHRFDLRIPPPPKNRVPATIIFPNSSTVLYMQPIHDVYFLSSYMNGQVRSHFLLHLHPTSAHRFSCTTSASQSLTLPSSVFLAMSTPIHLVSYVNSPLFLSLISSHQGIAVDSSSTFLFAAGQDRKLRAWSIPTAQPLLPPPSSSSHPFFSMEFPQPIQTLQTISSPHHLQEHVPSGITLWAGCGDELYTFHLGSVA